MPIVKILSGRRCSRQRMMLQRQADWQVSFLPLCPGDPRNYGCSLIRNTSLPVSDRRSLQGRRDTHCLSFRHLLHRTLRLQHTALHTLHLSSYYINIFFLSKKFCSLTLTITSSSLIRQCHIPIIMSYLSKTIKPFSPGKWKGSIFNNTHHYDITHTFHTETHYYYSRSRLRKTLVKFLNLIHLSVYLVANIYRII